MAYDPTTNNGFVRLLISDTDDTSRLFLDTEINAFLSAFGNKNPTSTYSNVNSDVTPFLAAWLAIGTIVVSRGLLAKVVERDGYKNERAAVADLLKIKQSLYNQVVQVGGLNGVDFDITDEHLNSYRPYWRELGDTTVE